MLDSVACRKYTVINTYVVPETVYCVEQHIWDFFRKPLIVGIYSHMQQLLFVLENNALTDY